MMHPCFSRTALVEDRGQDPVGVGERLPCASAGSPESFAAASPTALFLPLRDLERCQLASQGVQLRAGHTGQLWVGQSGALLGVPSQGFRATRCAGGLGGVRSVVRGGWRV